MSRNRLSGSICSRSKLSPASIKMSAKPCRACSATGRSAHASALARASRRDAATWCASSRWIDDNNAWIAGARASAPARCRRRPKMTQTAESSPAIAANRFGTSPRPRFRWKRCAFRRIVDWSGGGGNAARSRRIRASCRFSSFSMCVSAAHPAASSCIVAASVQKAKLAASSPQPRMGSKLASASAGVVDNAASSTKGRSMGRRPGRPKQAGAGLCTSVYGRRVDLVTRALFDYHCRKRGPTSAPMPATIAIPALYHIRTNAIAVSGQCKA